MVASVRSSTPAADAAFSSARRPTFVGAMMPASIKSTYFPEGTAEGLREQAITAALRAGDCRMRRTAKWDASLALAVSVQSE
jgi:hypothetical protein